MKMTFEMPWRRPQRQDCYFYHSVDLPDGEKIVGEWDLRGQFAKYIGGVNVQGCSVLDVGTASGFLAFHAEEAGARKVVAMDLDHASSVERLPFCNSPYIANKKKWSVDIKVPSGVWLEFKVA